MFGDRRISLYSEDSSSVASWYLALKAGGVTVTTLDIEHMTEGKQCLSAEKKLSLHPINRATTGF